MKVKLELKGVYTIARYKKSNLIFLTAIWFAKGFIKPILDFPLRELGDDFRELEEKMETTTDYGPY